LKRLVPDTIAGRAIAVLLLALTISHVLSMWFYQVSLFTELDLNNDRMVAERVVAIKRVISAADPAERERTAHALSGQGIEVHWSGISLIPSHARPDPHLTVLQNRLRQLMPDLKDHRLRVAYADEGIAGVVQGPKAPHHVLQVSAQLPDDSWINVSITALGTDFAAAEHFLIPTTLMAIAIFGVSIFLFRALTAPLRALAQAAQRLGVDMTAPPLSETGPRETRQAAYAFNDMQKRIRTLIADRTQMLAAISHDLRTPITAMRLRAEFLDSEERERMLAHLDEMQAMVSATLAFLRDDSNEEETKTVDLAALLATICDTLADAGHRVRFQGLSHAPLRCRQLALKRAFTNLINNAVKYGNQASVSLSEEAGQLRIDIDDDGPGVPEREREKIFTPFYRIEGSRSRETGGFGLGLTVARSVIRAHGGTITLMNRHEGGARVTAILPRVNVS
jgi:two-component system OmpR family sensor kinase